MAQYQNFEINDDIARQIANTAPDVRRLKDMLSVLADPEWAKTANLDLPVYYMHRAITQKDDLRYDITIIPPLMLGQEYNKTLGHYHLGTAELYIILQGEALFLAQERIAAKDDQIADCWFAKAVVGQSFAIPKTSAHFTINAADCPLVMANWIKTDCKNDYEPVAKMAGACYYYTINGWLKNQRYSKIPQLRQVQPLPTIPQNLDFLK